MPVEVKASCLKTSRPAKCDKTRAFFIVGARFFEREEALKSIPYEQQKHTL